MFILHLMSFKWSEQAPYPSYKTLAKRMGVTDKMVRRYAAGLEDKGQPVLENRFTFVDESDNTSADHVLLLQYDTWRQGTYPLTAFQIDVLTRVPISSLCAARTISEV
jgi:hypothetical protein